MTWWLKVGRFLVVGRGLISVGLVSAFLLGACSTAEPDRVTHHTSCADSTAAFADFGSRYVELQSTDGTVATLCVLVADTAKLRARGLMQVADLGDFDGMLFVFEEASTNGFWMKDTPLPLVVGWFDSSGALVAAAQMEPCLGSSDCLTYSPETTYSYALELPSSSELARRLIDASAGLDGEPWRLRMSQR